MHPDDYSGRNALTQRATVDTEDGPADHGVRHLSPPDGSIAGSGQLVCVYCAPCQRWIDCYDGIPPEVVLARHGTLFH
jgi:hypothetical protein